MDNIYRCITLLHESSSDCSIPYWYYAVPLESLTGKIPCCQHRTDESSPGAGGGGSARVITGWRRRGRQNNNWLEKTGRQSNNWLEKTGAPE